MTQMHVPAFRVSVNPASPLARLRHLAGPARRGLLLAALTAGAVAVALVALPYKTGLFIAALAGLVAGAAMPRERN